MNYAISHHNLVFKISLLALLLVLTFLPKSFSQIDLSQFDNARIYNKKDGLPANEAYKIIEDKHGFLWIGTHAGVSRFDGTQFTNFLYFHEKEEVKEIGAIIDLKIDSSQNRIWASGDHGIFTSLIDNIKFQKIEKAFNFDESLRDRVEHMLLDENQLIWTANYMTGLSRIDLHDKKIQNFRFKHDKYTANKSLNLVRFIFKDTNPDFLWLGTEGGLIHFNRINFDYEIFFFNDDPKSVQNFISYLYANEKYVFLGTDNEGLVLFDKSTKRFKQINQNSEEKKSNQTLDIYNENNKFLWVSTLRGLVKYNLATDSIELELAHDLSNDILRGISYIDSRGIIWFWSQDGLFRYDPYSAKVPFISLEDKSLLQKPLKIRKILYINGYMYVLGLRSSGLYKIDLKDRSISVFSFGRLQDINLRDMVEMKDGNLLIISFDKIFIFNPRTEKISPSPLSISHPHPTFQTLARDSLDRYWIGSNITGLYRLDFEKNTIRNYKKEFDTFKKENYRWIQKLYVDSKNNLWIAKGSNTVFNLRIDSLQSLDPKDTTISAYFVVKDFQEDSKGRIWMSSNGQGLGFTSYDHFYEGINHKIDQNFQGVYPYKDNMLFTVGNDLGVLNLETFEHKQIPLHYDDSELYMSGPIAGDGKGTYLIGCDNGVLIYDPLKTKKDSHIPVPYIRGIEANGTVSFKGEDLAKREFQFSSETKHLTVQLSALEFQNISNSRLAYRTQTEWIKLNGSQSITFSNLSPGEFSFEIKACNSSGQCNAEAVKYLFNILPPWYKTWWAYALFFGFFSGALFYFYRFRLQRKLEQQEAIRLKDLDLFKTRFYANITHEFRTPLTIIQGMANELEQRPKHETDKKISLIKKNSQSLLTLVNQMLDLSKLKAGKLSSHIQQNDIILFLNYLTEAHQSFAKLKNVGLQFYSEENELLMDFDAKKMKQVLNNLISNAVKFTREYGNILVVAHKDSSNGKPFLEIKVKDNGIGISQEQMPYIFDRFHQASSTHENQGSGIGLALVKELMVSMKGEINVESTLDIGSTFSLRFPISNNAHLSENDFDLKTDMGPVVLDTFKEDEAFIDAELPILLIIEDNLDVTYYLRTSLGENYQILSAKNGKEGVEKAKKSMPDIIISDVMMPIMDGFEVCKTLKTDASTNHIPIVLLTAKATSEDKLAGLSYGADAYLVKPFEKEEMIIRIDNLLRTRRTLQKKYSETLLSSQTAGIVPLTEADIFVQKIEGLILDNLDNENFTVHELSRGLLLSRSQAHRKIKAVTGMSTAIYIRHVRLKKAKELLLTTDLTVSEIAYQVGFKSLAYFSQTYKDTFGKSPSATRI